MQVLELTTDNFAAVNLQKTIKVDPLSEPKLGQTESVQSHSNAYLFLDDYPLTFLVQSSLTSSRSKLSSKSIDEVNLHREG